MRLEWDENKRQVNLAKHGLDFADAWKVLNAPVKMEIQAYKNGELRTV